MKKLKELFNKFFILLKRLFNKKNFTLKKIVKYLIILFAASFITLAILFIVFAKDLPTPGQVKGTHPIESSKIMDRNGEILYGVSGDQRRTIVESKDIPNSVKNATISAEDKNFYNEHLGFSVTGILRSVYYDLTGKKGYISGGSTITQQYVKNALLSPKKTFTRKIKELILTIEVEMMFSKDQILTMYLNEIPYGSNAYGIEEAAKMYFGKSAKDLNLPESATLASLPKAPSYYSPYGSHPDKLTIRKDYVLDRMSALKYITEDEASKAKQEKITFVPYKEKITAPHFVMYVKDKLVDMFGEQMVEEGGLKVTTTLDLEKQKKAEEAIDWGFQRNTKYGTPNAALVSIDPKTGQIIAMVGSHDYFDTSHDGQVNVTDSARQPGSSFKPIVYATAFKGKYNPASVLFDVTTDFGNYTPHNYNGNNYGPVTIRTALSNSLNVPAVKMLALVGINKALETAHDLGITTLNDPDRYGLSLVLGGGEVKPIDLTTAYGVFANNGTLHETTPILKVTDTSGKVLYEYNENKGKKEVLDPQVAYEVSSILSDNNARNMIFGNLQSYLSFGNRPVAVKTGTTQEYHDAWTVGYTPSIVTGVWVGNNDNTKMKNGADGSVAAAPIWHYYMDKILAGTNEEKFSIPDGIRTITVDKLSNKLPTDNSPEKLTDIFASWQVPTENDNIHVTARICKLCEGDKIASDICPSDQIEDKTYTVLHSEMPKKSNWENPVIAWAQNNGFNLSNPPTETCDLNGSIPSITIITPTPEQAVIGTITISTSPTSVFGIKEVNFYIDNVSVGTVSASPYEFKYDTNFLSTGSHKITTTVIDQKGLTATASVSIIVAKDTTAPGNVSNVILTPQVKAISISWKNPADSDLQKIAIYYSTVLGTLGAKYAEVSAVSDSTTIYNIPGLITGTKYYITLRPIDNSNNENTSIAQSSATAL